MIAERTNLSGRLLGISCAAVILVTATAFAGESVNTPPKLVADRYDSGFMQGHDTYNGMGTGSDGKIYYVLCTTVHDVAARMFSFDPVSKKVTDIGDLTEMCDEKDMKAVAQGK
ncbi:MAG: hypothetical protein WC655_11385, partial [Candidatus Hydrogenedentales bacterium]